MSSKLKASILFSRAVVVLELIHEVQGGIKTCPPGTYRVADWKEGDSQSRCRKCPPKTYSSMESIATACEACRREGECPIGTEFKNTCNATTDNICECQHGYYWKDFGGQDGRCYRHTTCKENEVVIKKGTPTEDTVCGKKSYPTYPTSTEEEKSSVSMTQSGFYSYATTTTRIPDGTGGAEKESNELTNGQVAGIIIIIVVLFILLYTFYARQNGNCKTKEKQTEEEIKQNKKSSKKVKKRTNRTF